MILIVDLCPACKKAASKYGIKIISVYPRVAKKND
jgi:hypothetical protein